MEKRSALYSKFEKYGYKIAMGILLIAITINLSFNCYGASIAGDEYFSMGFANNTEDFLFLTLGAIEIYGTDNWITGEFLHDWISVQEDGKFAIMPIHRNVRNDVHPPLYFMLLNFISSFFVDEVTLFPGYLINVISGIMLCLLIYLVMRKTFTNRWIALIPPLFWATSMAGSITMTYLRMYAPLCALTMLCLYLHILYMEQENIKFWPLFWLFGCTLVGTLTHYYYYIMQFALFMVIVITLLCQRQIKKLFYYGMSLFGGEVISIAAYPYVFRHLLYSERGVQVQENLVNSDWAYYQDFFMEYMKTINYYVFFNRFSIIFVCLILCVFATWMINILIKHGYVKRNIPFIDDKKEDRIFIEKNGKYNLMLMIIVTVVYFLILFKISYTSRWLYISPIFALLGIITIGLFAIAVNKMHIKNYGLILFVISCFFLCPKIPDTIEWAVKENSNTRRLHEEIVAYSDNCDVLFFYDEWNNLYDNQILELMEFDQIRAIPVEEIENTNYKNILLSRQDSDNLLLYIPTKIEGYESKIGYIIDKIGVKKYHLIREDKHAIYFAEL